MEQDSPLSYKLNLAQILKPIWLYKLCFYCYNFQNFTKRLSFGINHYRTFNLSFMALFAFIFIPHYQSLRSFFYPSHTKKLKILAITAPAYYLFLSASLFSGLVIWATLGFILTPKILVMTALWLVVFVAEIKRHKKQKITRVESNPAIRESFFKWARLKYLFDFCAFGFIFILWS